MTKHEPLNRYPRRIRPPYDKTDPAAQQHLHHSPPETSEQWRERRRADKLAALDEVIAVPLTSYEEQLLNHFADVEDMDTFTMMVSLLDRQLRAPRP